MPERFPCSARTSVSSARKPPSPDRAKISGMDIPAFSVIRASASTTSRFSAAPRAEATVDLPQPGIPMRMMFRRRLWMMRSTRSKALSSMGVPENCSLERLACATSMESPLTWGIPSSSACRISAVRAGLYTMSSTP